MSGFNTIKKSRKRSHEIEEKLNVLNRELEKTKDIQEQPTMHTSGIIVKSVDQVNQDHSDFEAIRAEEQKVLNGITEKYGPGTLDPNTGVFTPSDT